MGLAIRRGLLSYIESKVKEDKSLVLGQHEIPLLHYAVIPERGDSPPLWFHDMVKLLLRYGANPNQLWQGNSPWQHLWTHLHPHGYVHAAASFKTMLTSGASPFTTCTQNHTMFIFGQRIAGKMHLIRWRLFSKMFRDP